MVLFVLNTIKIKKHIMDQDKKSLIARIDQATNILVTVRKNPTVDHLAACIALTVFLNKIGKHATAVFSGNVPSTIEFLKPESTIEKTTDSLRDFIISLDKAKADKLRYKVEENVVKIFITPYRTSLSNADLNFSQGDFNVEVVLALGVHEKEDLDETIAEHGRILHDATIVSINSGSAGALGSINWNDPAVSSLSEMVSSIVEAIKADALDGQIATALLTGIVAETERFSNAKTSPQTMSHAAKMMSAGANQQLIATSLEPPIPEPEPAPEPAPIPEPAPEPAPATDQQPPAQDMQAMPTVTEKKPSEDGTLSIPHPRIEIDGDGSSLDYSIHDEDSGLENEADIPDIDIDEHGNMNIPSEEETKQEQSRMRVIEPPSRGGTLTANDKPEDTPPSVDPFSQQPAQNTILSHDEPLLSSKPANASYIETPIETTPSAEVPSVLDLLPSSSDVEPNPQAAETSTMPEPETITQIEEAVKSHHAEEPTSLDADAAREAVLTAAGGPEEVFDSLQGKDATAFTENVSPESSNPIPIADLLAQTSSVSEEDTPDKNVTVDDPTAPPMQPPPFMPPMPPASGEQGGNPLFNPPQ